MSDPVSMLDYVKDQVALEKPQEFFINNSEARQDELLVEEINNMTLCEVLWYLPPPASGK